MTTNFERAWNREAEDVSANDAFFHLQPDNALLITISSRVSRAEASSPSAIPRETGILPSFYHIRKKSSPHRWPSFKERAKNDIILHFKVAHDGESKENISVITLNSETEKVCLKNSTSRQKNFFFNQRIDEV